MDAEQELPSQRGIYTAIYWDGTSKKSIRFATAAASLKVTQPGLQMFPIQEIMELAGKAFG